MTLETSVIKGIVWNLLHGEDYREEIVGLINASFLDFSIEFFKKVVDAKMKCRDLDTDWYKENFLGEDLSSNDIAINAGLNKKTITNMYNSATREIVIKASHQHYDDLYESIEKLIEDGSDIDLNLKITFRGVSVDLSMSESLILVNTLAVKRAALRGGLWSTAGKRVENPLMKTLCALYGVTPSHYEEQFKRNQSKSVDREVDFYLLSKNEKYRCEVKLMGKGNPESADSVYSRDAHVFIADKLSDQNKAQLEQHNINWVELRAPNGFRGFKSVLEHRGIPHTDYTGNLEEEFDAIFDAAVIKPRAESSESNN